MTNDASGEAAIAACRERIRERNDSLNAVLHVLDVPHRHPTASFESTTRAAGPLAGVPYVLKDTWDTAGIPTTGGSWRHRERVPALSCHPFRALHDAGAVLLGKSNLCDLAFSAESDNHIRGPVRNPHDARRTAGGSTGGGAAAVAAGMAAFDWGTDFGGSIRGPAAYCGVVGLRLSAAAFPVGFEHFPRIAPYFWSMCGMGPLTRDVATARAVVDAVSPALRSAIDVPAIHPSKVVLYVPDDAHAAEWPGFAADARHLLRQADVEVVPGELSTPTKVNALFNDHLGSRFDELIADADLAFHEGLPAVLLALASGGRADKRIHPNTAVLFGALFALKLAGRDPVRVDARLKSLRDETHRIWSSGALIVAPTCTERPPLHGRSVFAHRAMSFCKLGNLVDATAIALPFGSFPASGAALLRPATPALPRSLQILGPPGSELAVLDLAARLESAIASAPAKSIAPRECVAER